MTDKERITTARDALLSYARHKRNIDAWTREEKELLARRAAFLSPSSPHLDGGHGGGGESSAVERAALYRARIDEILEELRLDMEAARVAMWRIENAFTALDDTEGRKALRLHFVEGLRWGNAAAALCTSERTIRRRAVSSMVELSRVLFHACNTSTNGEAAAGASC